MEEDIQLDRVLQGDIRLPRGSIDITDTDFQSQVGWRRE